MSVFDKQTLLFYSILFGNNPRTYVNLMITILMGGLWHGASWNFVLWCGLYGLYLALEHLIFKEKLKRKFMTFSQCMAVGLPGLFISLRCLGALCHLLFEFLNNYLQITAIYKVWNAPC